jgi:hypothetical protein
VFLGVMPFGDALLIEVYIFAFQYSNFLFYFLLLVDEFSFISDHNVCSGFVITVGYNNDSGENGDYNSGIAHSAP